MILSQFSKKSLKTAATIYRFKIEDNVFKTMKKYTRSKEELNGKSQLHWVRFLKNTSKERLEQLSLQNRIAWL